MGQQLCGRACGRGPNVEPTTATSPPQFIARAETTPGASVGATAESDVISKPDSAEHANAQEQVARRDNIKINADVDTHGNDASASGRFEPEAEPEQGRRNEVVASVETAPPVAVKSRADTKAAEGSDFAPNQAEAEAAISETEAANQALASAWMKAASAKAKIEAEAAAAEAEAHATGHSEPELDAVPIQDEPRNFGTSKRLTGVDGVNVNLLKEQHLAAVASAAKVDVDPSRFRTDTETDSRCRFKTEPAITAVSDAVNDAQTDEALSRCRFKTEPAVMAEAEAVVAPQTEAVVVAQTNADFSESLARGVCGACEGTGLLLSDVCPLCDGISGDPARRNEEPDVSASNGPVGVARTSADELRQDDPKTIPPATTKKGKPRKKKAANLATS